MAVAIVGLATACSGGGGTLNEETLDRQDQAPVANSEDAVSDTNQGASPTNESVARTDEPAVGSDDRSGSSNSFSCHGTYQCTTTGTGSTRISTIILNGSSTSCASNGSSINVDGTITDDKGEVVAQWAGNDSSFSFTSTDTETDVGSRGTTTTTTLTITVSCTKLSDSTDSTSSGSSTATR